MDRKIRDDYYYLPVMHRHSWGWGYCYSRDKCRFQAMHNNYMDWSAATNPWWPL